ncbi:MAG: ScyD/ScyE family protein [Gammaproteobacteria bacterium]|nr:ScyD/ScyE family protein [Gammaproteobacteria bacterium]
MRTVSSIRKTRPLNAIVTVALLCSLLAASAVLATALNSFPGPLFDVEIGPDGELILADASMGIVTLGDDDDDDDRQSVELPVVTAISPVDDDLIWAVTGGIDAQNDSGQGLHRVADGMTVKLVNLFDFEVASNPDGNDPPDSNPFDVQALPGNTALVADAGGNDLLWIDTDGNVSVVAVFPDEPVSTANMKTLFGCPDSGHPLCGAPDFMPAQAVPTSVVLGPDEHFYVGELKGFPAPTNESNIWRISPAASWADCGSSPDCEKVFDGGFTSIIDLAFSNDGTLYVAEMDENGWLAAEGVGQPAGGTINACNIDTATCEVIATGIPMLTAVAVESDDDDGDDVTIWATRNALIPDAAEVFQVGAADDDD